MISIKKIICLVLLVCLSFSLYSQDEDETDDIENEEIDSEEIDSEEVDSEEIDSDINTESLLFKTLALDIESADYYELLSWCQKLGLDDAGDKEALKIYADAYSQDPEFFKFVKSLQVYSQIMDQNTTLVLSTDSELFEYLNSKEITNKNR